MLWVFHYTFECIVQFAEMLQLDGILKDVHLDMFIDKGTVFDLENHAIFFTKKSFITRAVGLQFYLWH